MTVSSLWKASGTTGYFDSEGNFVPAERYGVAKSLFLNIVVLPVAAVCLAGYMLVSSLR
jgi:hypothetical protein